MQDKTDYNNQYETITKFDRIRGNLHDVALFTKATTVKNVQNMTGKAETFVIETARHEHYGDFIFIEQMDENGLVRIVLPPKVANAIASHRESLTKRRRSAASKATMKARKEAGEVLGFQKKKA